MAKEQQFIVAGYVRHPDGSPAEGVTIRVSDVDFRSEQPLGEALTDEKGLYKIPYTADQFRRAEKKSADLVARAYKDGVLRAESEIHYNVGQKEQINLTLKPMDEAPPRELTELEALLAAIEPVTGDAAAATFSDQEIRFLGEELRRCQPSRLLELLEREILQQILEFLRQADRLARETGIACDAYYGMFRQDLPSELDALLDQPLKNMREALEQAIEEKIIPDITAQLPDILERLRALRFSRGRLVRQRFVGRLLDDETGKPLRGHLVTAVDLDAEAEEQQLGSVTTDGRGRFAVNLSVPAGTPEEAIRRLRFNIFDDGLSVAEAEIEAKIKQEKVAEVRVHVREDERGDVPIADVASPALTARLAERGIHNLRDLLNKPDEKDEDDPEGLERARGAATWAVLAPELDDEKRAALLDEGLFSPLDVSAISRANFVRGFSERLGGDAAAYATYVGADEATKVLYNAIGSAWLADVNGSNDDPDNPDFPPGVVETLGGFKTCGCKDCDSAVSPAAYLAHLLGWTLKHLKDGEASITLSQLSEGEHSLHQPFGDIVADCQAVEEQVRQVRIACEELWRFNDWLLLSDQNLPFPVRTSYRQLRNELYRTILTNLGVPFAQLHKAVLVIESDNLAAETIAEQRRAVAERLGIDEVHLNTLFFDVDLDTGLTLVSPTEAELQTLFGYESTRRLDVFEPIPQPDLITWQRERLETIWREQDWFVPSDPYRGPNRRPFVEPEVITEAYLRELADNPALVLLEARQETLALHRQAMIATNPQDNGLAGFVALVEGELGQSIDQLEALYDTLQSGEDAEPEEIEQAHDAIIALNLTLAGFTFLMETHAHLANDEPLGLTEEEIETLQRLIRGVYTQEHLEELQHLEFDPEEIYELEWPVLGSYLTWRAFMLVYLYPENALSYSPYPRQSFGFSEYIKKALPAGGVIPAQACAAADAYSAYYQDVCQLEVQASCQVATAVSTIGNCEPTQSKPRQLVHLFGLTVDSGSVYTNYYDPYFETKDTLTSWRPLNKLQGVAQIIGAVPHETSTGMRYILLFVKVKEGPHFALHFVKVTTKPSG